MCLLCLVIYIRECFSLGLTMGGDHSQNDRWIWQLPPSSITCILGIYPTRYSHVMFMLEHGNGKLQEHLHMAKMCCVENENVMFIWKDFVWDDFHIP